MIVTVKTAKKVNYCKKVNGFSCIAALQRLLLGAVLLLGLAAVSRAATAQGQPSPDAADPAVIQFGYYNFPPRFYTENGNPAGTYADITRELFAEAGLTVNYSVMPIGRLYNEIKHTGRLQLWMAVLTKTFTDMGIPIRPNLYGSISLNLYGMPGNKPPAADQLGDRPLIAVVGFRYGGMLDRLQKAHPSLIILHANNHVSAFRMLKAGRAPYVLEYHGQMLNAVAGLNIGELEVTPVQSWEAFMMVSNDAPNASILVSKLESAAKRILARPTAKK